MSCEHRSHDQATFLAILTDKNGTPGKACVTWIYALALSVRNRARARARSHAKFFATIPIESGSAAYGTLSHQGFQIQNELVLSMHVTRRPLLRVSSPPRDPVETSDR